MRRMSQFGLALLALAGAAPASAQAPYQTQAQPMPQAQPVLDPEPLEGGALWDFSRCIAGQQTVWVQGLLASQPHSEAANAAIGALLSEAAATPCLGEGGFPQAGLAIDRRRLRGSLAQARYLAQYPDGAPPVIAQSVPAEIPVETFNARMNAAIDPVSEAVRIFADCVVANHAREVDRLVRTGFGSAEETAAIAAISPSMGACLWEGRSISFDAETLRAALADGLYRKANAIPALIGAVAREAEESGR